MDATPAQRRDLVVVGASAERAKHAARSAELLRAVLRREADQPPLPTTASRP